MDSGVLELELMGDAWLLMITRSRACHAMCGREEWREEVMEWRGLEMGTVV